MPYQVEDLSKHPKPKPGSYFFDTNALLYVMGVSNNQSYESNYIDFFNEVFLIATTSKTSRILTSSLQISELFNRLLKIESSKNFIKSKYTKSEYSFYKDVYRKGADIKTVFQQFKSDFLAYKEAFDIVPCPLKSIDEMLDFSPSDTDINDHLYTQLVKEHTAIMVTHDADLFSDDIQILTANHKLISASRNFVMVAPPVQQTTNKR